MSEFALRAQERTEVNWISKIRLPCGQEIACTIKDVSASGMKLALSGDVDVSEEFYVRVIGKDLIFQVKRAWRRGHFMGVTIIKIGKLPKAEHVPDQGLESVVSTPEYQRIGGRERYRSRM